VCKSIMKETRKPLLYMSEINLNFNELLYLFGNYKLQITKYVQ
jgi:hypothetical protein